MNWNDIITEFDGWGLCATDRDGFFLVLTAADGLPLVDDFTEDQTVVVGRYSSDEDFRAAQGCLGTEVFDSVQEAIDFYREAK